MAGLPVITENNHAVLQAIFFACVFLVLYTYAVYPAILFLLSRLRKEAVLPDRGALPKISLLIPVYNEKSIIADKLDNCRRLAYPRDLLEILVGSDSTDGSNAIIREYGLTNLTLTEFPVRFGKSHALSELVRKASGDIIIFSDANTFYNPFALEKMVRNFRDERVGGVCGRLILVNPDGNVGGWGESRYWRYENYLKYLEGKIHTTVGATGGIYAIRRELVSDLPSDRLVSDDLVMALLVAAKGYRVVFEREAIAIEATTKSIGDEFARKKRIGVGNFQALRLIAHCLHPRKGFLAFALWSHKIIRWFSPFFLIGAFITNALLAGGPAYAYLFLGQVLFYAGALAGWLLERRNIKFAPFSYPLYFVAAHFALLLSFFEMLGRTHDARWEQTRT